MFQTMQCQLSDQQGYAFFFYATHVDDTLRHLYLQFLVVPQAMLIKMIQLGSSKRIQGERRISIQICAKELNKEICAKELNKGLLKIFDGDLLCYGLSDLDLMVLDSRLNLCRGTQ